MKKIDKRTSHAFGKKIFLLGVDTDGKYVWLEEPKWDCGWYWGFGYVERYTNNKYPERARDTESHTHWDSGIVGKIGDEYVHHINENKEFVKTVLDDDESWKLGELMKTAYALRECAGIFGKGGSNISHVDEEVDIVKRNDWAKEINETILPKLFAEIDKLLSPVVTP